MKDHVSDKQIILSDQMLIGEKSMFCIFQNRYFIVAIVLAATAGSLIAETSFIMALQAMTVKTDQSNDEMSQNTSTTTSSNENHTRLRDKVYNWDQTTQSLIFGLSFIPSVILKPFVGALVQRFGGKWFFTASLLSNGLLCILFPFTADYIYVVITLRLAIGVNGALIYPSVYSIIVNWVPASQRSLCFSMITAVNNLVAIITLVTIGLIHEAYGWPGLFFTPGIISVFMGVITLIFLQSKPKFVHNHIQVLTNNNEIMPRIDNQDKIIDDEEKEDKPKSFATPYLSILKNKAFLSYMLFIFTRSFMLSVQASKLPVYLIKILHEDIGKSGNFLAILSSIAAGSAFISGYSSRQDT